MIKHEIKNSYTGDVQFTAEVECEESASLGVKRGLAVRWAIKNGAKLSGANLSGAILSSAKLSCAKLSYADLSYADLSGAVLSSAKLSYANLSDANLSDAVLSSADLFGADLSSAGLSSANLYGANLYGAAIIDGGQRSDGFRFVGWIKDGVLQISAGCREFTITKAREHWANENYRDRKLSDEAMCILDHIEAVAKIRGLIDDKAQMERVRDGSTYARAA